jgi:hypothetical protein
VGDHARKVYYTAVGGKKQSKGMLKAGKRGEENGP